MHTVSNPPGSPTETLQQVPTHDWIDSQDKIKLSLRFVVLDLIRMWEAEPWSFHLGSRSTELSEFEFL